MQHFDVVIIGGGINGVGCAADAALRGLSVLLCEQDDLASKTSSSSSKLIHGGLRYLEHFDFKLVKKALDEQQRLLNIAPHLIQPLPFVLPHTENTHPKWQLHAGLFLYDHLSPSNTLPNHHGLNRQKDPVFFEPLKDNLNEGFLYYDCQTDDARLVIENALQAEKAGATILTNTQFVHAISKKDEWHLTFKTKTNLLFEIRTKVVINAAGPWTNEVNQLLHIEQTPMSLIKGSHIVVPKCYEGEHAYLLQDTTERIIFMIPFHGNTLIGTTEKNFTGDPLTIAVEPDEINYLCDVTNRYLNSQIKPSDCITTWTGLRPLVSNNHASPTALSRDYMYTLSKQSAFVVSIISGKITTYRQLAEDIIDELSPVFPTLPASNTSTTKLPGALLGDIELDAYQTYLKEQYPFVSDPLLERYIKTYGVRTEDILTPYKNAQALGLEFGDTLFQAEVDYLIQKEWATTAEDILWRRTKLGLIVNNDTIHALKDYLSLNASIDMTQALSSVASRMVLTSTSKA